MTGQDNNMQTEAVSRRGFLGGFGALGAGAALMTGVASCGRAEPPAAAERQAAAINVGTPNPAGGTDYAAPAGFNPLSPEDNLRMWLRLIGYRKSGEEKAGWYKGRCHAILDDMRPGIPLFDYEGFGVSRIIDNGDGTYQNLHREVSIYRDIRSGAILETWDNPLTGKTVEVYPTHNDPVNSIYKPVFEQRFGKNAEVQSFPFILPWDFIGNEAITSFDANFSWESPYSKEEYPDEYFGPTVRASEWWQVRADADLLFDPEHDGYIQSRGAWTRVGPWQAWMHMGELAGDMVWRTQTASLRSVEDVPADLYAYVKRHYPRHLNAPTEWEEPNETSHLNYMRDKARGSKYDVD